MEKVSFRSAHALSLAVRHYKMRYERHEFCRQTHCQCAQTKMPPGAGTRRQHTNAHSCHRSGTSECQHQCQRTAVRRCSAFRIGIVLGATTENKPILGWAAIARKMSALRVRAACRIDDRRLVIFGVVCMVIIWGDVHSTKMLTCRDHVCNSCKDEAQCANTKETGHPFQTGLWLKLRFGLVTRRRDHH